MRYLQQSLLKTLVAMSACVLGMLTFFPTTASATSIPFSLSTYGCFGAGCTTFTTAPSSNDLKFTGVTIPAFTVDTGGDFENLTFGAFSLVPTSGNATQVPSDFTLELVFTSPT